jgi:DNA-binding NarL/FixJ family response regulator
VTSILIADDHEVVRLGLRAILETRPNCEVVAEALDGKEAILKAIATKPDIAVLADTLPVVDGLEATRQIRASLPQTEVLVFAMHHNEMLIEEFLKAGARGYVRKSDAKRRLLEAIEALAAHRAYFSSAISQMLLDENPAKRALPPSTLTARQRAVVQLVAEGYSNKQIGRLLNVSTKTVDSHRRDINDKLNLSKSAALVRYAVRNKLVKP